MMISNRPLNTVVPATAIANPAGEQVLPGFKSGAVKFGAESGGKNSKPMVWNPFVLLFTGIKKLYQRFSQTGLGKWFNGILQKINQRLQASKKAPPKAPAAPSADSTTPPTAPPLPAPCDEVQTPAPIPAPTSVAPEPPQLASQAVESSVQQASDPVLPEGPPTQPVAQVAEAPAPPVPLSVVQEPPKPVIKPYSDRSLAELEGRLEEYKFLEAKWKAEQEQCQTKLDALNNLRQLETARLQSLRLNLITAGEKHLKSEVKKAISLLDQEIGTLSQQITERNIKQGQVTERMPLLEYWINLRKKLAT